MTNSTENRDKHAPRLSVVYSDTVTQDSEAIQSDAQEIAELISTVGRRVRDVRKAQGKSRRVLSEQSGVSVRYLAKLEVGDGNISIALLKKLSIALQTPIHVLLSDGDIDVVEFRDLIEIYRRADPMARARAVQILDPMRTQIQKAQRLCLVGLRGAGKSTLGMRISAEFSAPFIELNKEIEKDAGMPVGEIMALYGQEGYRNFEANKIAEIVERHSRAVVAVAGGIVSDEATFSHVLSRFHTVWLKANAGDHMDRVRAQGDIRPMDGNPQAMLQLRQILKERESRYAQADHLVDTSGQSIDETQAELSRLIKSQGLMTGIPA